MEELNNFFEEYNNTEKIESPLVYKKKNSISLQFCGWDITLYPNGTYILSDTTGG